MWWGRAVWTELETALENKRASCIHHKSAALPLWNGLWPPLGCSQCSNGLHHETGLDLAGPGGYHVSVHPANPGNKREQVRDVAGAVLFKAKEVSVGLASEDIAVIARTAN